MKEFIFTWDIKNISYAWHRRSQEIVSPSFVADSLIDTVWNLILYPRGYKSNHYFSLYLCKKNGDRINFSLDCELSCVSENNLVLTSSRHKIYLITLQNDQKIGNAYFLLRREVFNRKKDLYIPQDILKLRCRLQKREDGIDEIGQSFACTFLKIERIVSVEDMNPRTNKKKTVSIYSKKQNILLISVDVSQQKDGLRIKLHPTNNKMIKFSTFKFLAVGKNREPCRLSSSWLDRPRKKVWQNAFSKIIQKSSIQNKLKITCEFIYSTGEETNSIEKVSPCLFKFPEFSTNTILSCIPSGKLIDCPNICKDLWNLYTKSILCDVELKTPTTSFWVHKTVLCARSPVFLTMFANDMKEKLTNCVEIEDLKDDTLGKLVKFLYTDIFEETQWEAVLELYYTADKYQMERLKKMCGLYFLKKINDLNACELFEVADKYSDADLKWEVEEYVIKHHHKIFMSSMNKSLISDNQLLLDLKSRIFAKEKESPPDVKELSDCLTVVDDLKWIYLNQIDCDVIIRTPTAQFPAHKAVLCAGSSTLRNMFTSGKLTNTLKIEGLEDSTVTHLLLFLYTDSLGYTKWEDATKLFYAASVYQIERLKFICSCFFLEKLDLSTANNLLQVAYEHRDSRLKSLVEEFIFLSNKDISDFKVLEKSSEISPSNQMEMRQSKRLKLEYDI